MFRVRAFLFWNRCFHCCDDHEPHVGMREPPCRWMVHVWLCAHWRVDLGPHIVHRYSPRRTDANCGSCSNIHDEDAWPSVGGGHRSCTTTRACLCSPLPTSVASDAEIPKTTGTCTMTVRTKHRISFAGSTPSPPVYCWHARSRGGRADVSRNWVRPDTASERRIASLLLTFTLTLTRADTPDK